jgi:hypothetical protein
MRQTLLALLVAALGTAANGDTIHVPADHPTIQAAIVAASAGDEVVVAPGTYNEAIDLLGKAITLRSSDGPLVTVLDGTGLKTSIIRCVSGEGPKTRIEGFTVTNGLVGSIFGNQSKYLVGGGLFASQSSPTIEDCRFVGNRSGFGGGAYLYQSQSTLRNCVFHDNIANTDGGGAQFFSGSVVVDSCVFTFNQAPQGNGGGAHFVLGTPTVLDSVFANNTGNVGGGFRFFTSGSEMVASGLTVTSNIANGIGGGFAVRTGYDSLLLSGSEVCANQPNAFYGQFTDLGGNAFCTGCPGDLNGNGIVDGADASIMLGYWGFSGVGIPIPADLNNDGTVDAADLATLLGAWGACTGR